MARLDRLRAKKNPYQEERMSHLKCTAHERRVIVVGGKVLHRSTRPMEFTADCDTETVLSGAAVYKPDSEHFNSKAFPKVKTPEEKLLQGIFEKPKRSRRPRDNKRKAPRG